MKYTSIISEPGNDVAWGLQIVANEIAESNRLKRIEISHQYFSLKINNDHWDYDSGGLDKLLEDKA